MKYVHPEYLHEYVRIMPGKPHNPHLCQRKPYVNHRGKVGISFDL